MARPLAIAPDSAVGPSNHCRGSATNASGRGSRREGERRDLAGMAAGTGRYQDQAVGALLDRLVGEFLVDHVVKHDAAPTMRSLADFLPRPHRGDDDRHLVLLAEREVMLETVV